MRKKLGKQSIQFENKISILATASVVGPKEGQGPLSKYFDIILQDELAQEDSWEKAESKICKESLNLAIQKSGLKKEDINYILSGDLLNQSSGTTFGIKDLELPFFGIFGACSTMGEGMSLAAILIDGEFADSVIFGASSHFCAAEKQFRFPLELGTQRPPTSTWTVTGQGSAIVTKNGKGPYVKGITTGKIIDLGVSDVNNMGAAMAPAAADTMLAHFKDFGRSPDYYDVIATGDLGYVGKELIIDMLKNEGYDISRNYTDCGIEIFDRENQDTHSGGSGCGCSAVTFAGMFYDKLVKREINRLLFIPTGALLSTTSSQQGQNIPSIAHAVAIEN